MAYIQDANDPNAQQQPAAPGAGGQPPQTATGSAGAAGVTTGSPQGVGAVPNTTQAPPVQNLQAYLEANAPQAVQMGQNIAGNLNQTARKVTGDINAAKNDVGAQVQAQNIAPNQALVDQAASNPSGFVQNPQNLADFLAQKNANYTGPANFESTPEYSTLVQNVQNAKNSAPDINKPGGVQQLVAGQEKNPTMGMENLDTLILQENPQAMAPIQAAIPQFGTIPGALTSASSSVNGAIQKAIANDQASKAGVQSRFLTGPNAVVPQFKGQLQGELDTANTNRTNFNNEVSDIISRANSKTPLTAQELADVGATQGEFGTLNYATPSGYGSFMSGYGSPGTINYNPYSYFSAGNPITTAPTIPGIATPQDVATEKALEQLLESNGPEAFTPGGPAYSPNGVLPQFNLTGAKRGAISALSGHAPPTGTGSPSSPYYEPGVNFQNLMDWLNGNSTDQLGYYTTPPELYE